MATTKPAAQQRPLPVPRGAKCHICPKPAASFVTFTSVTQKMRSLWLCRQCFKDTWALLTESDRGKA